MTPRNRTPSGIFSSSDSQSPPIELNIDASHQEDDVAVMEPGVDSPLLSDAEVDTYSDYHVARKPKHKKQPRYNVILWDDSDHSYEYVVLMMKQLFAHPMEQGFQIAEQIDNGGKAICLTTTMEHAELKRDQIHAFGKDELIARCKGSMSATIEPVPED